MTLFVLGLLVFCVGVRLCIGKPTEHDLEQAALLPFADDPQAARAMSEATGYRCDKVITPLSEPPSRPVGYRLDA